MRWAPASFQGAKTGVGTAGQRGGGSGHPRAVLGRGQVEVWLAPLLPPQVPVRPRGGSERGRWSQCSPAPLPSPGRPGEQASSQRAELEGSLALGAGPSSLQGRPRARSCAHGLCQAQEGSGASPPRSSGGRWTRGLCRPGWPEKGLDLCLACARPSARGRSQSPRLR